MRPGTHSVSTCALLQMLSTHCRSAACPQVTLKALVTSHSVIADWVLRLPLVSCFCAYVTRTRKPACKRSPGVWAKVHAGRQITAGTCLWAAMFICGLISTTNITIRKMSLPSCCLQRTEHFSYLNGWCHVFMFTDASNWDSWVEFQSVINCPAHIVGCMCTV